MTAATINDDIRQQAEHALHTGDFTTSERLYAQLLDIPGTGADTEDASTLQVRADYALALYGLGDFAAGESQLRRALAGQEHLLGPHHPATVITTARLAETLGEQLRWPDAYKLARTAVERALHALDADHPAALTSRLALAWVMSRTTPMQALPLVRATLTDIDRVLGAEHRDTLAANHLLLVTLRSLGKREEAETVARHVIATREQHQGPQHPHTLRARADLALVLDAAGREHEARTLIEAVVEAGRESLGTGHPFTIRFLAVRAVITG